MLSKSFNFLAQWDQILNFGPTVQRQKLHSGTENWTFGPTVDKIGENLHSGTTKTKNQLWTDVVKKFAFFAQWDQKNGPKSRKKSSLVRLWTNVVKKFAFFAQWDQKKSSFGPSVD